MTKDILTPLVEIEIMQKWSICVLNVWLTKFHLRTCHIGLGLKLPPASKNNGSAITISLLTSFFHNLNHGAYIQFGTTTITDT